MTLSIVLGVWAGLATCFFLSGVIRAWDSTPHHVRLVIFTALLVTVGPVLVPLYAALDAFSAGLARTITEAEDL